MWSISVAPNRYLKDPKFFFLFVIIMITVAFANGQQVIPSLHKNVNLPSENLRFDSLLHLIARPTGIKFSLNTQKFRPSRIIHVRKGIQSVDEILSEIKNSTGIYYRILGDHIIFIDKPPTNYTLTAKKRADKDLLSSLVPLTTKVNISHPVFITYTKKYLPLESIDTDTINQAIGARVHSMQMDKKYLAQVDTNLIPRASDKTPAPFTSRRARSDRQRLHFQPRFFAESGLTADENFYITPSISAGWSFLYGIAQWSTNFNVSGLRYGLGGSLRLTDRWRIGLIATTGAYSKDYQQNVIPGFPDITVTVKTGLQKLGILAEMRITRKIQMRFGPVLNKLLTNYYNPLGVSTPLFISESDANNHYQYIKPLFTIQDTYSPVSARNTKVWIGLQASLFYNINFLRGR